MLVYEKDNKLNINFDNKVDNSPDLSIGKSGDKTQILVDGQPSGGGGALIVTMIQDVPGTGLEWSSETTYGEVYEAMLAGRPVFFKCEGGPINVDNQEHNERPVYPVLYIDFTPASSEPPYDVLYGNVRICLPNIFGMQPDEMSIIRFTGQYLNTVYVNWYD